ncbi:MAG: hypothetical protein FJ137_00820 [Deltaproteobacteria bacterium]|nr:hypothetical protein [Deltaproteobacteria bacterium]
MTGDERYPRAVAALRRLLGRDADAVAAAPLTAFRLGPAVLRAPPALRSRAEAEVVAGDDTHADEADGADGDLLGELVDMVLVGADDEGAAGVPEVRLQFKASVLGGLHLRLQKTAEGLVATFTVADAAARRAVVDHIDALLVHLKARGFAVARHAVEVAPDQAVTGTTSRP